MDQMATSAWPHQLVHDPTVPAPVEEDFTSFLDLGDFSINFSHFDVTAEQHGQDAANTMDMGLDDSAEVGAGSEVMMQQSPGDDARLQHHVSMPTMAQVQTPDDAVLDLNMHAQLFQQQEQQFQPRRRQHRLHEQVYHPQLIIPPTPNSIEMHASAARYIHQMDPQAQVLHYQRLKDAQAMFTPLVSPAVTPLDTQFSLPEFTVPGAYLSPLTSPALDAQHPMSHASIYHRASCSETSLASSPIDIDIANPSTPSMTSQLGSSKRTRRLSITSRTPNRITRQSPTVKSHRPKPTLGAAVPNRDVTALAHDGQKSQALQGDAISLSIPIAREHSESESISPEPLTEALMGPPPPPRSAASTDSPRIAAMNNSANEGSETTSNGTMGTTTNMHPATPASIMKLRKQLPRKGRRGPPVALKDPTAGAREANERTMQQLHLSQHGDSTDPTSGHGDAQTPQSELPPNLSGTRTPTTKEVSLAAVSAPTSAIQNPQVNQVMSPNEPPSGKKFDDKGFGRGNKKRANPNSVQVSPALRPKISPSIKPLLPEGATLSAETSTLLLASKSNYQNILEGTHLPGVSYPEALSTNISSKRTSHKIAEQGRRNRINSALQEMASLLPAAVANGGRDRDTSAGSGAESGGGAGAHTAGQAASNSKASTVEMAIEYIKELQRDLSEARGKLEATEKKLEESAAKA